MPDLEEAVVDGKHVDSKRVRVDGILVLAVIEAIDGGLEGLVLRRLALAVDDSDAADLEKHCKVLDLVHTLVAVHPIRNDLVAGRQLLGRLFDQLVQGL